MSSEREPTNEEIEEFYKNIRPVKLKIPSREELEKKSPSDYNEVDKMVSSLPFRMFGGVDLISGMEYARELLNQFNSLYRCTDFKAKREICEQLFGTYIDGPNIKPPFRCDYGANIHFGKGGFVNHDCVFLDGAEIRIGDNVLIAPGVHIYTPKHSTDPSNRHSIISRPVRIGNDCWIGG